MKYTRKNAITKRNIKESFLDLLDSYNFDLITVNKIVEEAEITRSTFYRHYEDKYDLLSEIEEEILTRIHEERERIEKQFIKRDLFNIEMFKQLFIALEPYSKTIYHLLSNNGDLSFEMKLKNEITKRFTDLEEINHISKVRADLMKEYMYAILIKTFQYWSANNKDSDLEEIASTLQDVQLKGMRKAINL